MVCGVNQWDVAPPKSCDSHMDQSDSSLHPLFTDYINRLFSVAKENTRVRGLLSSMFKGDPALLLNTLAVVLQLDGRNHPKTDAQNDYNIPRYNNARTCTHISFD